MVSVEIVARLVKRVQAAVQSEHANQKTLDWAAGYAQALTDINNEERMELDGEFIRIEEELERITKHGQLQRGKRNKRNVYKSWAHLDATHETGYGACR